MSERVKVKKSDPPESKEILAEAIVSIGHATRKLLSSGLNKKAIIVLINAETKLGMGKIETVLNALPQLERWYLRK